jgi:hypothetical protein
MTELRESELAWHLIEEFRGCLTAAELTTAFVDLGVGDYTPVIQAVLHAVARSGQPLPSTTTALRVQAWMDCYDHHPRAAIALTSPAEQLSSGH